MDSSRKVRVSQAGACDRTLIRPVQALLESTGAKDRLAVALSGGPDSSALAVCTVQLARRAGLSVRLFHIHHGLLPDADLWLDRVRHLSELLKLELVEQRVTVDRGSGLGMEAAARLARHEALETLATAHDVQAVLFAHHRQDQAETVLQRLFRGAGVAGLAAMRPAVKKDTCWWLRPWLNVPRRSILECMHQFERQTGWRPIQDPTNLDPSLARGMIRAELADVIERHWPGWVANLARHAEQAAQAQALLLSYGRMLLEQVADQPPAGTLDLARWRSLEASQQALVLRTWLTDRGLQMPTERRLAELCRQLNQVHAMGHDRALRWQTKGGEIRCVRSKIHLQVTM